ncbi:hypothetical protein [Pseudoalteromonas sp. S16_S37]|uniref:hypothetical protein n=1 Tax=Pseudoalteromonas sp. S16_S37 TaxID=2720228 RepID=UPI00168117AD|nr:hypothetical protein [Pseudoalteromonas sp. S16_S37]MBD1584876.1 hypothetical protein [Pseudoalteromonas sp. S16_S37]
MIELFNKMQQQVLNVLKSRTVVLGAISHDIRAPLTALKLKIALVEDDDLKASLNIHIDKIEQMITSSLDFLKGPHAGKQRKMLIYQRY